jgi:hypothetical protein
MSLSLPRSVAAHATHAFAEILVEELLDHASEFPLDEMTHEGGEPDPDSLEISIAKDPGIERVPPDKLLVSLSCFFDEEITSASCDAMTYTESCFGTVRLVINTTTGEAYFAD